MAKHQKPGTLVIVSWVDAETSHGWEDASEAKNNKPPECKTVGWVIHSDDESVILAQTISGEHVNGKITIPMGWVSGVSLASKQTRKPASKTVNKK